MCRVQWHYIFGFVGFVMVKKVSSSGGRSCVGGAYEEGAFGTVCILQHYKMFQLFALLCTVSVDFLSCVCCR